MNLSRSAATRRLAAAIFAGVAAVAAISPSAAQEMDPEERAVLRSEVRKYLLEHPEVVMEALRVLEQRRQLAEAEAETELLARNADALFDDGYSHVAGNPDGDVTVVEFLDYNCGYCKRAHSEVKELISGDDGIRYVIKEFPILGPGSRAAAQAAMAAMEQEDGARYLAFNDALMAHRGRLDEETVYRIAGEVGLDVAKLREDAAGSEIEERIAANYAVARELSIEGTPTFIIGDKIVRGYVPLDELRRQVAAQREKKEG